MRRQTWITGQPFSRYACVKSNATVVRFGGLEDAVVPSAPKFLKSLMIAFGMNGEQLPLLNGFPLKLFVPGRVRRLLDKDAGRHRGAG
jgi:DMSO/TMAO reductase YedYZ molybdopterin-dependent catalytic subunit